MSNEFCGTCGRHYEMCVCAKMNERVRILGASLFNHIKHGDAEHQAWLKREALVWCALNFGDEPIHAPPPPSSMSKYWKVKMLAAASQSGDEGTIRLAMQLADALPCDRCGFVKSACRCYICLVCGDNPSKSQNPGWCARCSPEQAEAQCPKRTDCEIDMIDRQERKCPPDRDPVLRLKPVVQVAMHVSPKWLMRCVCRTHINELVRIRDHENNVTYERA